MLSKPVYELVNEQITHEMASAYLYLQMAAWFEDANLPGFAHWMKVQFEEEQEHAMKFFEYIHDQGSRVELKAIPAPEVKFASPKEIFEKTLAHEKLVTSLILKINEAAKAQNDVATQVFLQWFVTEQIEEEKNASTILDLLEKVGGSTGALYQLDHQVGKRGG